MEKRYLKKRGMLVFDFDDLTAYFEAMEPQMNKDHPEIPKTVTMEKLHDNIGNHITRNEDGSLTVFEFYYIDADTYLVLSKLGVSAISHKEYMEWTTP
jgi:hypothetical protein